MDGAAGPFQQKIFATLIIRYYDMDKQDINLELSAEEINLLLEGLGSMPFVKVYTLIGKIQQQASVQLNKASLSTETTKGQ
jgi:hypothetical protein